MATACGCPKRIIELAKAGERNADRLCEYALTKVRDADGGTSQLYQSSSASRDAATPARTGRRASAPGSAGPCAPRFAGSRSPTAPTYWISAFPYRAEDVPPALSPSRGPRPPGGARRPPLRRATSRAQVNPSRTTGPTSTRAYRHSSPNASREGGGDDREPSLRHTLSRHARCVRPRLSTRKLTFSKPLN
jgi:hypothetical protein